MRLIRRCGIVLALVVATAAAGHADLRAASAKADITPDVSASKIPLGGYGARRSAPSTGIHDHVYAHALVLAQGKTHVAVVSVDLCFFPSSIKEAVYQRLLADGTKDIPADHIFIAATHSHSAPDPLAMHAGNKFVHKSWTTFDQKLTDFTVNAIAGAISTADHHLTAALVGAGVVKTQNLNHNRRGEQIVDPDLTLVKVTDRRGKPIAAIVDFASHPVIYSERNMLVSADWPGPMASDLEQRMGTGAVCLFLNGAEGDASPTAESGSTADERVINYGHLMAETAAPLLTSITPSANGTLDAWIVDVKLPKRQAPAAFLLAAGSFGASVQQARQLLDTLMPDHAPISFVRIGDILLMGFPCEPIADIGLAAKDAARAAGYANPATVALTNEWLGYCLTPEKFNKGGYEPSMSFYGDQLGPTLLSALSASIAAHPARTASR
jgi:hypothetical protein